MNRLRLMGRKFFVVSGALGVLAVGAVSAVALGVGSATATSPAAGALDAQGVPEGFITAHELVGEFGEALDSFEGVFPASAKIPGRSAGTEELADVTAEYAAATDELVAAAPGGQAFFEEGYAESDVVMFWMCSWEKEYVDAYSRGDKAAAKLAGDQLANFYEFEYVKRHFEDPDRAWFKAVVAPALEGDLGMMKAELRDCTRWVGN